MVGVVVATALLVGVGMLDDRYDLDALTKFAAQVTAAGLLVLYGVQWVTVWIPIGGESFLSGSLLLLGQGQSVLMTVLVTVVLVNAMNFVDGLDGLAAGIGLITTLATAVFCVGLISKNGNDPAAFVPSLIAVVLAGSCLGFLPHNFHPARIFMGDTGSMMVGVMLSAAITTAWPDPARRHGGRQHPGPGLTGDRAGRHRLHPVARPAHGGRAARGPGPARSARTRCTCTTGCCRSGTATGARCCWSTCGSR